MYKTDSTDLLTCYVDSSLAGDKDCRSRYGYVFYFMGGLVSWCSSLSTRILLSQQSLTYQDNQSAIRLSTDQNTLSWISLSTRNM